MAYTSSQKKDHIREVQSYLLAISMFDKNIPQVMPSGVYDSETEEAVRAFQRVYGLAETGEIDGSTWNKIVSVYRSYISGAPAAYNVFPSRSYIVKEGASGQLIYIIQAMLSSIGSSFDNMPKLTVCGNFNDETMGAVKDFQGKMGLPLSGFVDCDTWNMLVQFCEHCQRMILK